MIKDGESHALIHEMDIVYMWIGVSGTLTECNAHDISHGWEDIWSITRFDCVTGPLIGGNTVILCVGVSDLPLLRTIRLSGGRCILWYLCSGTWRQMITNGIHRSPTWDKHPIRSVVVLIVETPVQGILDWKVFQCQKTFQCVVSISPHWFWHSHWVCEFDQSMTLTQLGW